MFKTENSPVDILIYILKKQSCKLYNDKYRIASTQITKSKFSHS